MNYNNKIQIYYPKENFLDQPRLQEQWYGYILRGFKEIGCEIVFSDEKTKNSRCELTNCYTVFDLCVGNRRIRCIYDWSDFVKVNWEQLPDYDLLFKIQFHKSHLNRHKMRAMGQTVALLKYFDVMPDLRREVIKNAYSYDINAVLRATNVKERSKCIKTIKATGRNVIAGLSERANYVIDEDILIKRMEYVEHLYTQTHSKINVAMFGIQGDWTWRHTEILGMGACLMTLRSDYLLPGNPAGCWIEIKRDFSDLADKAEYYLTHEKERLEIAAAGRNYFDKVLSPAAQAKYIIDEAVKVL
jgi:hypothetical protein